MEQLDLLDEILLLSEGQNRSLDCVLAFELDQIPDLEVLKLGAKKAQNLFLKTARHEISITQESDLEAFANRPLPSHFHLEEAIIGNILALKMSHVLGDAVSMILFLKAQLGEMVSSSKIELQSFPAKNDSQYRHKRPSTKWLTPSSEKMRTISKLVINHREDFGKFSLNDLLSLALLRSLPLDRRSLWVPVNVRKNPWEGFGNGLSRMRIYPARNHGTLIDELTFIRKQKKEAWTSGEIFLPPSDFNLKKPLVASFLKLWINRPWADWGSISFSHLHDKDNQLPDFVRGVWGVTNIPEKLNAGLFAFTKGKQTFLTLVSDQSKDKKTLDDLLTTLSENFHKITKEL